MPQVEIMIGGRSFEVACQEGEEPFLQSAAAMLDTEASALSSQIGRMPEGRMLLMAGLMLADKTAGLEERLREVEATLADLRNRGVETVEVPVEVRVEVPVVPVEVTDLLEDMAAQAEWLAQSVAAKAKG
jgi:cell division protein ZapA